MDRLILIPQAVFKIFCKPSLKGELATIIESITHKNNRILLKLFGFTKKF